MPNGALPSDSDDYSLPGRVLDSNGFYQPVEPTPKPKSKAIWIIGIAFVLFSAGFFAYYFANQPEIDSQILENTMPTPEQRLAQKYNVGEYGSEHVHAAIGVFLNGHQVHFGHPKFQLTNKYIHFENHNPYMVHKHATGAPLDMLFSSFGMMITQDCINNVVNGEVFDSFCTNETQTLQFYINGERVSEIAQYEINHNDRILITLSDEKEIQIQMDYLNSLEIYDIPRKTPQYSEDNINI